MDISLPVYVKVIKGSVDRKTVYRTQLLFSSGHHSENIVLQRAIQRLTRNVRNRCDEFGKGWNQRKLLPLTFNPASLQHTTLKFDIQLRKTRYSCKYFMVWFQAMGRCIAFCPELPGVWFEFEKGELQARAEEVYLALFRKLEKDDGADFVSPDRYSIDSKSWLTSIDVTLNINQESRDEMEKKMLSMWTRETVSGDSELTRVGRCLDWLYPDDLDRAFLRDREAETLLSLLELPDRRPVLLVGDSLVGKTTLIHEVVARRVKARQDKALEKGQEQKANANRKNVWLLAPQRLISGMSYVGQWEQRVHAILKTAAEKKHTLYFDDLIGLFRAGKSSSSNLCVADLLRKPLQQRKVRFLAECTTGQYEQLLNLDRSFADLFHVMHLDEMDEDQTLRVCIKTSRTIEHQHQTNFDPDALPTVIQLQRQYGGAQRFPGKAVRFLKQIGIKLGYRQIRRNEVLQEMAATSGIQLPMVDDQQTLLRKDVVADFENQIVGQKSAVNACVDLVMTEKARLSPQGKPIMTLLFTGPTGVGKTETAKALANYLFGDAEKMVRFDLNEFKTGYSAARLVGTFDEPEGLLTSAIRHRPYSVILFDEIEKAHPDVFDVLLQVIGEGRLTDAIGRTTDFGNTVIVMTSNLGARRASQTVGFVPGDDQRHYIAAAEKFFRPEFFNRIDRVVPFHHLDREQIAEIAEGLMRKVVSREGLMRRRCILNVGPALISDIVDVGYDQAMGARGLKRAIEQHFTHPVAAELSSIRSETPTLITVRKKEPADTDDDRSSKLSIDVLPLENVETTEQPVYDSLEELGDMAEAFLDRIRENVLAQRPDGEISGRGMSPELLRYFALVEEANQIEQKINQLRVVSEAKSDTSMPAMPISQTRRSVADREKYSMPSKTFLQDVASIGDIHQFLQDAGAKGAITAETLADQLVRSCRVLEAMAQSNESEAIFFLKDSSANGLAEGLADSSVAASSQQRPYLHASHHEEAVRRMGFDWRAKEMMIGGQAVRLLYVSGSCVTAMLRNEIGFSLCCDSWGRLTLDETGILTSEDPDFQKLKAAILSEDAIREPVSCQSIETVRRHQVLRFWGNTSMDFRTEQTIDGKDQTQRLLSLIQSGLPLPNEFSASSQSKQSQRKGE
ncbi:AAA family ATPase [Mariniblastus fucicola]|uniref:ATP-dependent Clp protease ATP-binding subunit ClpE n=1 Tax=Mariniblastus fucicola TaxID=980251 RepID=A0A5B9P7F0_9BACT|nr:AAA family ATPase [Mariniblastus fucicola]QEG20872.1 ATP-dependent Clp protease ATP-binding subunit ClpE [Mariniblastus fucicola]